MKAILIFAVALGLSGCGGKRPAVQQVAAIRDPMIEIGQYIGLTCGDFWIGRHGRVPR